MFTLEVGGGKVVQVEQPVRTMFAGNLSGAVQFSLANTVYKVLEVMGGSLGSFAAGFLVKFLDILEPALVEYLSPFLDLLLAQPDMPEAIKEILVKLKTPTSAAAAALLTGLGTSATGAVAGSVLNTLLAPVTYFLNTKVRPARPAPAEMQQALWRHLIGDADAGLWYKELGWADPMIKAFPEILRPRVGVEELLEIRRRKAATTGTVEMELKNRGFNDVDRFYLEVLEKRLLNEEQVRNGLWRELIDPGEWRQRMQYLGYADFDINILTHLQKSIPGPSDLVRMGVREAFSPEIYGKYGYHLDFPPEFAKWMGYWGFDEYWAKAYWAAKWELPSVQLGYEMLHKGIIDKDGLALLLRVQDYPIFWRDKMIQASYNPYTRVDVRRMYRMGVLGREDVKKTYMQLGYDEVHAENLAEFTVRYETRTGDDKREGYKELTQTLIEQAYSKGVISIEYAAGQLKHLGYDAEDVSVLTQLMQAKSEIDHIPDWATEHSKDYKNLIEKAYTLRLISRAEAAGALADVPMAQAQIDFILAIADYNHAAGVLDKQLKVIGDAYVSRAINRTDAVTRFGRLGLPGVLQEQHLSEWDIERELRSRRLTPAEYRKAFKGELITEGGFRDCLAGLGFTDFDIDLYVQMS